MKKTITLLLLALLSISYARGAEGDVTTNADIDFSGSITGTSPYTIAGTVGSMTWTQQWTYAPAIVDGILRFGNFDGGVVALQGNAVGERDVVTIKFDLAFGKLNTKHVGFKFVDKDGNTILEQLFDAYNSDFDDANPLGLDWAYMYRGSNTVIQERCVNFTITLDYAAQKITTNTTCLLSGASKPATNGEFEVSMPSNVGTIAQFVLEGNINNTGRYATLDNLKITTTEGNYEVELPAYAINYIYGNNTIKTTKGNLAAGTKVEAENPIVIDNVKYFAADGASTSLTLSDDADKNVLNVNLREAGKKTVSVNAVAGSEVLQTWSGERIEGNDAANIYFNRAVKYGDDYYTTPRTGSYFAKSMSYTSSDVNVDYTHDESIVYYAETENMNISGDVSIVGANAERASGGVWRRVGKSTSVYTDQLTPGVYKIEIYGRNQSATADADLSLQTYDGSTFTDTEKTFTLGKATTGEVTIENIELGSAASFAIVNTSADYASNISLDYVIVYRTGDLKETITVATEGTSTYVTTYPLDFSNVEGLTVLIATDETEDRVVLSKVTQVPAGAPIIVKGEAGDYSVPVCDATTYSGGLTNKLEGSATASYIVAADDKIYAIKKDKSEFRPVAADVEIPAKKAYFRSTYPISTNAKPFIIRGEEEGPTAVSTVEVVEAAKAKKFFNAAGQQVDENYKGFVITSAGKKIIKK